MQKRFMTNSVLLGAFFALLMMLPVSAVFAQGSTTAALAGTVVDEKGQGLPGASVIAVHEPTGSRYGASTRADGRYNIVNMRVGGPYKITISFVGYKNAVQSEIVLTLAQELRQNFKLEIIGEAVNRILKIDAKIQISNASKIVNLRNWVIHSYDNVDSILIWVIIQKDIPVLQLEVQNLLKMK